MGTRVAVDSQSMDKNRCTETSLEPLTFWGKIEAVSFFAFAFAILTPLALLVYAQGRIAEWRGKPLKPLQWGGD